MGKVRNWFTALNDLWTAYQWVIGALWWTGISSSAGVTVEQIAAAYGASPLGAIGYGLAAAFVATALGILYRLYQLNQPAASVRVLPTYIDDFGHQIGALEFVGTGGRISFEAYCTSTAVGAQGNDRLIVPSNRPGVTFTLSRTERHHVPIIKYDFRTGPQFMEVSIPTKRENKVVRSGSKFRLTVVAYAGLVREQIELMCWISRGKLHLDEIA
jgi:hypothetical protein